MSSRTPKKGPSGGNRAKIAAQRRVHAKRGRKAGRPTYLISQVPHRRQRYDTVGDWIPGDPVRIRVSKMNDERYVFLVALHELVEYELCRMHGITDSKVVEFDMAFEKERRERIHSVEAEPGDDPRAPYREEHGFASMIERIVAQKLGVNWSAYEEAVQSLSPASRMAIRPMVEN